MKQTFKIPDGCKEVTIEQIDNQIVTTFEPKKYTPKAGDYVKMYYTNSVSFCKINEVIGASVMCNTYISRNECFNKDGIFNMYSTIEKITTGEYKSEFEKLGYTYDEATDTASKKRWRAEEDGEYYFINGSFEIQKIKERYAVRDESEKRFSIGNYHRTMQQAEQYRDFMLKKSLEFNTNNK